MAATPEPLCAAAEFGALAASRRRAERGELSHMELPFTPDQFFGLFADYNRAFWTMVVAWWMATVVAVALVWRHPVRWSPVVSGFIGVMWLWNAVVYHAFLFTRINPAAWVFSALFAIQAVLLLRVGLQRRLVYLSSTGTRQAVGVALMAYALAYPFLTMALGHAYPATPTYGLPCPTVILTIGLLMTTRDGAPWSLAVIPIIWGFIGGSAAMLLQVPTDSVLLAAGVLLLIVVAAQWIRLRLVASPHSPQCGATGTTNTIENDHGPGSSK